MLFYLAVVNRLCFSRLEFNGVIFHVFGGSWAFALLFCNFNVSKRFCFSEYDTQIEHIANGRSLFLACDNGTVVMFVCIDTATR